MPVQAHDALALVAEIVEKALAAGRPALDEAASKQVLAAYGVPVPQGGLVHSAAEAADLVASLGVPVAMKATGALIQHKTEKQLVVLNVRTSDEAAETYAALAERAGEALEAVLVEEMVAGSREFMVGMNRDAAFGPVVAFGLGGTMTEVFRDIALAVSPGSEGDVAELPGLIRSKALLGPFRGQAAVDQDKLTAIIEAVARIAADHPRIAEIDVNPILIRGSEPVAADALMVLSAAPAAAAPARPFTPDLEAVLAPKSVAIVGASGDVTRWGGSAVQNILAGGFKGAIYPVNPKGGEFFGLPVSTGLDDLPAAPDLALLAVGARQLPDIIPQCGEAGVRAAVAIAAGFSETGEAGKEAEAALARAAADAGVTLIGPNCMGLIANATQLHATGFIALHPRPGSVAIVSQSGNLGVQLSALADRRDLGVRCFIGVGNEAQVSAVDVLEYLADDDGTSCVLAYVEGIDDGRRLFDVAAATSRKKPVVVLRGGLTEVGGKAAASHTGAMAGSAAVYEAAARQTGLVTCTSVQEALDLTTALANLPLPRGRRIAVVTNGGGAGVLAADEMGRAGAQPRRAAGRAARRAGRDPAAVLEPPEPVRHGRDRRRRRRPSRDRRSRALPGGGRGDRALRAGRAQHRRRGPLPELHRRLRRLQPVGAALPRRRRCSHGGDRQADHQRPRPPDPPRRVRRRPSLLARRAVHAARRRVRDRPDGALRGLARSPHL